MKVIYYLLSFSLLLISALLNLESLVKTSWIVQDGYTFIGLYKKCSIITHVRHCQKFPMVEDCNKLGGTFCSMWSSAGYTIQTSFIFLIPCLFSLILIACIGHKGGKRRREGWKLMSVLILLYCKQVFTYYGNINYFIGLLEFFSIGVMLFYTNTKLKGHLGSAFFRAFTALILSMIACVSQIIPGLSASYNIAWAKEEKDHYFGRVTVPMVNEQEPLLAQA